DLLRQVQASTGQPPTPAHVATLGKMAELGIPLQYSAFEALHALDNGPKLHDLLGRLIQNLQAVLPEQEAPPSQHAIQPAPTPVAPMALPSQAQPATTTPASSMAAPTVTMPQPSEPSPQPSEESGVRFPENKISRPDATPADRSRVSAESQAQPAQPLLSATTRNRLTELVEVAKRMIAQTDASPEGLGEQAKRLGLGFEERVANAVRRLPPDSDPETVRTAFQQAVQADPNKQGPGLKQALLLAQAAAPELEAAGMHQLAQDVSRLLSHVTGQQVMQTAGQERSDLFYQFAAVPMQVGGQQQTVELHVMSRKSPGQKQVDPANCYILFRLDMPNLGPLDIHLHIVDKVVGLRFQTEAGHELVIDPSEQRDLRAALQQTGFHLGVLKIEEKKPPEESAHLPLLPPILTQGTLDLKL
ncbi:MAG: flagellar hook-length control protein FliK, partial [Tumebacillaceae bacterium]